MRSLSFVFLLFCTLYASPQYEDGKRLYRQHGCFGCHGRNLEGMHNYPYLANRAKGYMKYKLERFRSKLSDNQQQEMMIPFAVGLSDKDIENLAIYMNEFVPEDAKERYDDSFKTHGHGGS